MLLAIDVGNTNTVFAVYDGQRLVESWRCHTTDTRTSDEYAAFLSELFKFSEIKWSNIHDVIISSVVPEAIFHIKKFCKKYTKTNPIMVSVDLVDIEIDLEQPEEIGADRLVNAAAVINEYKLPVVVIDFGTATTFDVIDSKGRYCGGAIAPGVNLSIAALHQAAAKLPSVSVKKPQSVIGKSTTEAIQSGIYWGYIGLIEGIVERISKELGQKPQVIATGGLAPLFSESTPLINKVDAELTLKGLLLIYQNIKSRKKAA